MAETTAERIKRLRGDVTQEDTASRIARLTASESPAALPEKGLFEKVKYNLIDPNSPLGKFSEIPSAAIHGLAEGMTLNAASKFLSPEQKAKEEMLKKSIPLLMGLVTWPLMLPVSLKCWEKE